MAISAGHVQDAKAGGEAAETFTGSRLSPVRCSEALNCSRFCQERPTLQSDVDIEAVRGQTWDRAANTQAVVLLA